MVNDTMTILEHSNAACQTIKLFPKERHAGRTWCSHLLCSVLRRGLWLGGHAGCNRGKGGRSGRFCKRLLCKLHACRCIRLHCQWI